MASIKVFDDYVETPFVITNSAYPGEYFILCDDKHDCWEQLENIKRDIRDARDVALRPIQRYTIAEVALFLTKATEYHFHGLESVLNKKES